MFCTCCPIEAGITGDGERQMATSRIAFTNEELDLIDSALRIAADQFLTDAAGAATTALEKQFERQARLAKGIRETIETQRARS